MVQYILMKNKSYYPPKESSLKNLSEGSHWFECSLYLVLFLDFVGFPLGTRRTYCVVGGGGCWVVGGAYFSKILKSPIKKKNKLPLIRLELASSLLNPTYVTNYTTNPKLL